MEWSNAILLIVVSFGASWLTFFSGFGLGTLLTPVFYLILKDLTLAIAATAVVHLLNNLFKFALMQRNVNWKIVIPFGIAAVPAAALGAYLISHFTDLTLFQYLIFGSTKSVKLINLVFGIVLIGFALIELVKKWSIAFSQQSLWLGGLISGFFGGLSGHQGALRTAFLVKYKLKKQAFIATGIVIALVIDFTRIPMYFKETPISSLQAEWPIIITSVSAAILGAILGKLFLKKIQFNVLTIFISIGMIIFGLALVLGFLEK
ncbi:MAG: sulfite exporter TauE/SafE family protein [Putridiphycobacter sp.]|nr:sulfite exporter TauE/SafE family protein [Putridiphycobacter sp.]